jgi:hypothetical protein
MAPLAAVAINRIRHLRWRLQKTLHQACAQAEGGIIFFLPHKSPLLALPRSRATMCGGPLAGVIRTLSGHRPRAEFDRRGHKQDQSAVQRLPCRHLFLGRSQGRDRRCLHDPGAEPDPRLLPQDVQGARVPGPGGLKPCPLAHSARMGAPCGAHPEPKLRCRRGARGEEQTACPRVHLAGCALPCVQVRSPSPIFGA